LALGVMAIEEKLSGFSLLPVWWFASGFASESSA